MPSKRKSGQIAQEGGLHRCVFCKDMQFGAFDTLLRHLQRYHFEERIEVDGQSRWLYQGTGNLIFCFCGTNLEDWQEFAGHLLEKGGLEKHYDDVVLELRLDAVGRSLP